MKHLLKGLLYSTPWWASCAAYTYFHMQARPICYLSDVTIWLYCFCCGAAWVYYMGESAHEEDRQAWEAMHTELNHRLISQAVAAHAASVNGHKEVSR